MTDLSIALKAAGFVFCHMMQEADGTRVKSGVAYTFDFNNGICAVYDENSHAWVLPERLFTDAMAIALFKSRYHSRWTYKGVPLDRGARVPHSNDGGAWAARTFPKKK